MTIKPDSRPADRCVSASEHEPVVRLQVIVAGIVQGVGFRPYVHRIAQELQLGGWIENTPDGALLEAEGKLSNVQRLLARMKVDLPAPAKLRPIVTTTVPPKGEVRFEIRPSSGNGHKRLTVPPDLGICSECTRELSDPDDRRFRYPFVTCTRCGPRYSILTGIPYDRSNTTMDSFPLCGACRGEYDNLENRRYHAEAVACPVCGPSVALWDDHGQALAKGEEALRAACRLLSDGRVLAVKGLGGYQLWVDARSETAIQRLRLRKSRPHKPFAVLFSSPDQVRSACAMTAGEEALLTSSAAPIVILDQRAESLLAAGVAPGNPTVGAMLPYTPLHRLLTDELGFPVVATSGNRSDEPIAIEEPEALDRLSGIADAFLVHDRPIARPVDDSVVRVGERGVVLLRRARGYVPAPVHVADAVRQGRALPPLLAVGGHLKNTVAMAADDQVLLSQHLGDLSTMEACRAFRRAIRDLRLLLEREPEAIACDLHPDYHSSRHAFELAQALNVRLIPVQHHHAHVAACMAEHGLMGEVLGVAWDGAGYGTDGTIWGGEFLVASYAGFTRFAHLRPYRLPGGEAAAREPRRSAVSLLWESFGEQGVTRSPLVARALGIQLEPIAMLLRKGVAAPISTSMGRLFDGVASLTDLCQVTSFEGQAALLVQHAAEAFLGKSATVHLERPGPYRIPLGPADSEHGPLIADWRPFIEGIVHDVARGADTGLIAYRFHEALAELVVRVAIAAGKPNVVLTGGCFQNGLLLRLAHEQLEASGFSVYSHHQVPSNDGGLALGQVLVAAYAPMDGK